MREGGRGGRPRDEVSNREECRLGVVKGTTTKYLSLERNGVICSYVIRKLNASDPLDGTECHRVYDFCVYETARKEPWIISLADYPHHCSFQVDKLGLSTLGRCRCAASGPRGHSSRPPIGTRANTNLQETGRFAKPDCPSLQIRKGVCPAVDGEMWQSCSHGCSLPTRGKLH